jgi:predicted  nucleic acid-binding Zn-ribbon protein
MPSTAHSLKELHELHQRARAIRDRLASGPKTLATRETILTKRKTELDAAKKALLEAKAAIKRKESEVKNYQEKVSDLRVKLNAIKKQVEYDALRNQIAHDNLAISNLEEEILTAMFEVDEKSKAIATQESDVAKLDSDVAALKADIETKAVAQKSQLAELETALVEAEEIIDINHRDQYRRNVKQRGDDAMAPVENGACSGCYVSTTHQMMNHLIMCDEIVFCKTCGRLLYLAEESHHAVTRASRA